MPTITDYLIELDKQRNQIAANLNAMGIATSTNETLNTLAPKILQIATSGDAMEKLIIYDADHQNYIYLQHNGIIYHLADFIAKHPDFCSAEYNYALNYSTSIFGWDDSVYTCCTTSIKVTSSTQVAVRFLSNSTETGVLRLVQSDSGTPEDILTKAKTDGSYIDLSFQWLYTTDYITTLSPCTNIPTGSYYLVWIGRSNNSHPLISNIMIV